MQSRKMSRTCWHMYFSQEEKLLRAYNKKYHLINSLDVDCRLNIPKFYTKTWNNCHRLTVACSCYVKL